MHTHLMTGFMNSNEEILFSATRKPFLPVGHFTARLHPTRKKHHNGTPANAAHIGTQVIARKARIKYVALLNVLFYKWLGYPAGISAWHCAPVTTTISPTHACLSMGASSQKSNVRCYPSPLSEKDPAAPSGAQRPCFPRAGDGNTPLLRSFRFGEPRLSWLHHDNHITKYLFSISQRAALLQTVDGENRSLKKNLHLLLMWTFACSPHHLHFSLLLRATGVSTFRTETIYCWF